jgi:hypothetical protein
VRVSKRLPHGGQRILCSWTDFPKAKEAMRPVNNARDPAETHHVLSAFRTG